MKTTAIDYRYRVFCMRVETTGGLIIRATDYPTPLQMGANVYQPAKGYELSVVDAVSDMSASAIDITGIINVDGIDKIAVMSGLFDNADVKIFAVDWRTPVEDAEPITSGLFGKVSFDDNTYKVELLNKLDQLNAIQPRVYAPGCGKDFGSTTFAGCKATVNTYSGTVTSTANAFTITDSAMSNPAGLFTEGLLLWTSGANLNTKPLEIKSHAAGGVITTHEPWLYTIAIGDTFTVKEGCAKTKAACISKNNILNFGGFPSVPDSQDYMSRGGYDK